MDQQQQIQQQHPQKPSDGSPPLTQPLLHASEMDHQDQRDRHYNDQPGLEAAPNHWASAPIPYAAEPENQGPAMSTEPKWIVTQQQYPVQRDGPPSSTPEKRRILGLTVPVFWGLVIALVIILAAGIAGGVAGGLITQNKNSTSNKQDSQNSATATATSPVSTTASGTATSSSIRPAPTDAGCPGINATAYAPTDGGGNLMRVKGGHYQAFQQICEVNYPSGAAYGNPQLYDILKTYVSSFEDCMTLCAAHNIQYADNLASKRVSEGGWCRSVAMIKTPGEYCYLKNGTGKVSTQAHAVDFVTGILTHGLESFDSES
ncbi:uncharacterized protein CTRU02_215385 [Colletotrichum truncatum]|uniref:Uncharacterized protein n=1 Tax=Colletotrichum truncatum TaxID=5467 RepID=A0ACC3YD68_COLTU|nr:uncharacterized protein CTRU02_13340 [Colletotrichum truncatum]KAF6783577.1 hypothetical protein CTRU02_13340 [Colletotrichum truncatum]